jgi:hypothetical protein
VVPLAAYQPTEENLTSTFERSYLERRLSMTRAPLFQDRGKNFPTVWGTTIFRGFLDD